MHVVKRRKISTEYQTQSVVQNSLLTEAPWQSKFDYSDSESDTGPDSGVIYSRDSRQQTDSISNLCLSDSVGNLLAAAEFEYSGMFLPGYGSCRSVEEFEHMDSIGAGTFGKVYRARDKKTGQIVAMKRLLIDKDDGVSISALRETKLLKKAQHPNVVSWKDMAVNCELNKMFIVMECLEYDVRELIRQKIITLKISEVKTMMLHLLRGVQHLHDNFILHRDLKLSNLLVSRDGILKIADLGLAREYSCPPTSYHPYTPVVVTLWYRAPELLLGAKEYGPAIDMWSVGCILAELLNGRPLFPGRSQIDQLQLIFQIMGTPTQKIWPDLVKLPVMKQCKFETHKFNFLRKKCPKSLTRQGFYMLNKLLVYDPKRRVTAEEAGASQWFVEDPSPEKIPGFSRWQPLSFT